MCKCSKCQGMFDDDEFQLLEKGEEIIINLPTDIKIKVDISWRQYNYYTIDHYSFIFSDSVSPFLIDILNNDQDCYILNRLYILDELKKYQKRIDEVLLKYKCENEE